jgi:uncharacterized membrane protein
MKKKIVIRIRRKNEFNRYWVFFVFCALILAIAALMVETVSQAFVLMFMASIIIILALLYQGFEVVTE